MLADLLTRIKNGQQARLASVKAPFSRMDFAVAELLAKHKYLESAEKKGRMPKRIIEAKLRYDADGGVIHGVKLYAKPSRRVSVSYKKLPAAHQGFGLLALSTPKGILTATEARKAKVGGILLFEIW
ncbi:MAG: 30S ribosomal protein S8 [bacterium]|nr:30S ribosomal protein S8 [bacterium]